MVQSQLVDYISAQLKLGASRETIKTALLGAGWQVGDVDDSFKKIDMDAAKPAVAPATAVAPVMMNATPKTVGPTSSVTSANAGQVAGSAMSPAATAASAKASAAFFSKPASTSGPQVFRMSDLVSNSGSSMTGASSAAGSAAATGASAANQKSASAKITSFPAGGMSSSSSPKSSSKMGLIMGALAVIIILALAGFAGYLYMQNSSLSSKVASMSGQSAGVTSQVASLTNQVNALTASTTANATAMAGLTSANAELMTELSFYAVPPGGAVTTTAISVTGSLNENPAKEYFIIASYGGKIFVTNSKSANVIAALTPLVGSSTQLAGQFIPGSDTMTVTSVNGNSLSQ